MKCTQFLIFEACTQCNLARRHGMCPTLDHRRYASLPHDQPLSDEQIVEVATRMYREFGFQGLIGWHYYNEPLVAGKRVAALMRRIRENVPESRFVLWTNGTVAPADPEDLKLFEKAFVTDYSRLGDRPRQLPLLQSKINDVQVIPVRFDQRRQGGVRADNARCLRPFTEFIVDYYGNVHLCCYDWQGSATVGNLRTESLDQVVARWQEWRRKIVLPSGMALDAPAACRSCWMRSQSLDPLDARGVQAAQEYLEQTEKSTDGSQDAGGVPSWGQLSLAYKPMGVMHAAVKKQPFKLLACVGTWHDADIIGATVRNCLAQGCDEVFIIDNDSPDDTVAVAREAGAKIADVYHTDFYLEAIRLHRMNSFMEMATREQIANDGIWWLTIDADEFVQGPNQLTLREYLVQLAPWYNIVGVHAFDHYPTTSPQYLVGKHPADFQPYGMLRDRCGHGRGYWKHPLLFYPKGTAFGVCQSRGMHSPFRLDGWPQLLAPEEALLMHHVPFREKEATFQRLRALCEASADGTYRSMQDDKDIGVQGASRRYQHLEAIYSQQWEKIEIPHDQAWQGDERPKIAHWSEFLSPEQYEPRRWY
jgi:hypothetical protein